MPEWTKLDDDFLKFYYPNNTVSCLALWLNHTEDSIEARIKKLNLSKNKIRKNVVIKYWTYAEIAILKTRMSDLNSEIAKDMHRSTTSVRKMKAKLRKGLSFPVCDNQYEYVGRKGLRNYRDIAAAVLGRELKPFEHVHHIDVNKLNNNPINLFVCNSPEHHGRTHAQLDNYLYGLVHTLMESGIVKFENGKYVNGNQYELIHLLAVRNKEKERCSRLGIPWKPIVQI